MSSSAFRRLLLTCVNERCRAHSPAQMVWRRSISILRCCVCVELLIFEFIDQRLALVRITMLAIASDGCPRTVSMPVKHGSDHRLPELRACRRKPKIHTGFSALQSPLHSAWRLSSECVATSSKCCAGVRQLPLPSPNYRMSFGSQDPWRITSSRKSKFRLGSGLCASMVTVITEDNVWNKHTISRTCSASLDLAFGYGTVSMAYCPHVQDNRQ